MSEDEISLIMMIQDLLLNQILTKRELAKTARLSVYKINQLLEIPCQSWHIKPEQAQRVAKLYTRMKPYEPQISEFLVSVKPYLSKRFDKPRSLV